MYSIYIIYYKFLCALLRLWCKHAPQKSMQLVRFFQKSCTSWYTFNEPLLFTKHVNLLPLGEL